MQQQIHSHTPGWWTTFPHGCRDWFLPQPSNCFLPPHTNAKSAWLEPPQKAHPVFHLASPHCNCVFHLSRAGNLPYAPPGSFFPPQLFWKPLPSQRLPSPGMQRHVNPPILSRQVASFWHGLEWHSLMSISQRGPVYPFKHSQWKEPSVFTHFPACSHGLLFAARKINACGKAFSLTRKATASFISHGLFQWSFLLDM